jgi:hypothetical protein
VFAFPLYFLNFNNILPTYTPLAERNSNSYRGLELSEFEHGRIISIHNNSAKKKTIIQKFYDYLYSIISDTISKNELHTNGKSLLRSGTTKSYSPAEKRKILRHVWNFPKDIYKQVIWVY